MNRLKSTNKLGWIAVAVGVLILLTPWILPVCKGLLELANGKQAPMRCFWTARAEILLAALVVFTGIQLALAKETEAFKKVSNMVILSGLAVVLTPLYIMPTCMNPEMACNIGTKPALLILGGLTFILGLVGRLSERRKAVAA